MTKILIVDDEPTVRALLRDVLEIEGYEIVEANDGEGALAAVEDEAPELLVLDVMMPGMSGIDVLMQLREQHSNNELPIILLTAASDDDTTWRGWSSGASIYLQKPFDPSHLLDWVQRLISEPSATGPADSTSGNSGSGTSRNGPDDGGLLSEFGGLSNE